MGGMRAPHHNFVVTAPIIMKFGTGVEIDVFYTVVTKKFVTSLLLRHCDVITLFYFILEVFWGAFLIINSDFSFENF